MKIVLDKICLVGGIEENIPRCVVKDISLSLGMSEDYMESKPRKKLLEELELVEKIEIDSDDYSSEMLGDIARFVNCAETEWTEYCLFQALFSLIHFSPISFRPGNNNYGDKTNDDPEKLDVCSVFRVIKYHHFPYDKETSFEEMIRRIESINLEDLLIADYSRRKGNIGNNQSLDEIYNNINTLKPAVLSYLHPQNSVQAIVFSAFIYGIDISPSSIPIVEFIKLKCENTFSYAPEDPIFRKKYIINPSYYNIRRRWNPYFNFMYSDKDLITFSKALGFETSRPTRRETFNFLQEMYLISNFYAGPHPHSFSETPIYREEITSLQFSECVSYGCESSLLFVTYTFDELNEFFERSKCFFNPTNAREIFSVSSIKKLESICVTGNSLSSKRLLETIRKIKKMLSGFSEREIIWMNIYETSSDEEKDIYVQILHKILHLGMYMRGWKVSSDHYPLTADECIVEPAKLIQRDLLVTECYTLLDEFKQNYPVIVGEIFDLPLLQYKENYFLESDKSFHGFTIGQRLDIVRSGEDVDNIYSCIRLSSNYICASVYRYLTLIKKDPGFPIKEMRWIS